METTISTAKNIAKIFLVIIFSLPYYDVFFVALPPMPGFTYDSRRNLTDDAQIIASQLSHCTSILYKSPLSKSSRLHKL
jgi:hypothetical protein